MGTNFLAGPVAIVPRGNGFKLKEGRFRLAIRKKFFTTRVVKELQLPTSWKGLPRDLEDAPSLETFKVRLDGVLRNLISLKMALLTARGLDYITFKGAFQHKQFYD